MCDLNHLLCGYIFLLEHSPQIVVLLGYILKSANELTIVLRRRRGWQRLLCCLVEVLDDAAQLLSMRRGYLASRLVLSCFHIRLSPQHLVCCL